MIKAAFFDIDGTLLSFKTHRIPASAQQVLDSFHEQGIACVIATGRPTYQMPDWLFDLGWEMCIRDRRMAVATSRMEAKCIDMVHELGLCQFEAVVGMNPPQGRETKADSVRDALAALGATADGAVMIGDRFNDVEGAHAMGVPCIGIYSGAAAPGEHEAAGADAVVHSVAELAKLFAI